MNTNFLNKPYPITLNKWKLAISVSLFISFFLSVFQPFGLQFVDIDNKMIILIGYGVVTFIILLIILFFIPFVFKKSFSEEGWTVWKQILWLSLIVFTISLANYGYSILFSIFQWVGYKGFLIFILFTFSIAIIPIVVITFISQNLYLKKNLTLSDKINDKIDSKSSNSDCEDLINLMSGNQTHKFQFNTIIFFESIGNYVNVNFIKDGQVQTVLIRNTLKNICSEITQKDLFKCHRAFAINTQQIEKVEGNSHGILVTMKHIAKQVPVSRNNTKAFSAIFIDKI